MSVSVTTNKKHMLIWAVITVGEVEGVEGVYSFYNTTSVPGQAGKTGENIKAEATVLLYHTTEMHFSLMGRLLCTLMAPWFKYKPINLLQ